MTPKQPIDWEGRLKPLADALKATIKVNFSLRDGDPSKSPSSDPVARVLNVPKLVTETSFFASLHELGHIATTLDYCVQWRKDHPESEATRKMRVKLGTPPAQWGTVPGAVTLGVDEVKMNQMDIITSLTLGYESKATLWALDQYPNPAKETAQQTLAALYSYRNGFDSAKAHSPLWSGLNEGGTLPPAYLECVKRLVALGADEAQAKKDDDKAQAKARAEDLRNDPLAALFGPGGPLAGSGDLLAGLGDDDYDDDGL